MAQAIRLALHYGEENLDLKDIFGQDVGPPLGGVFTLTQGLKRAWNTPLDERGIVGALMGMALTGSRVLAEIQFCDYIFNSIDLLKIIGNTHWASNGGYHLPLVLMTPVGSGIHGSIYHSHSFDSWAVRIPGWKVVIPSNPLDAYRLMLSAIIDPNPVMYLAPKALLRKEGEEKNENNLIPFEPKNKKELKRMIDAPTDRPTSWKPLWPKLKAEYFPIGKGKKTREGKDATLVSFGRTLPLCNQVADLLKKERISLDVIDLCSLYPYDWKMIKTSVKKTGRVLFVNEDTEVTNFGEHLSYRVTSELFYELLARPRVLAGKNVPGIGLPESLEQETLPQESHILSEVKHLLKESP